MNLTRRHYEFLNFAAARMARNGDIRMEYKGLNRDVAQDMVVETSTIEVHKLHMRERSGLTLCQLIAKERESLDTEAIMTAEVEGKYEKIRRIAVSAWPVTTNGLTSYTVGLYGRLHDAILAGGGTIRPGEGRFAENHGISEKTLQAHLSQLNRYFGATNTPQSLATLAYLAEILEYS